MKIAIVVPVVWNPLEFSTDPRRYAHGFHQLGHETVIVCLDGSSVPAGTNATTGSRAELASDEYWRALGTELAVVFTWMSGYHDVILALRRSGAFVVSKGDTDGLTGVRVYPRATAARYLYGARSPLDAARRGWAWTKRYAYLYREADSDLIRNLGEADATFVETPAARENLLRLLQYHRADHLFDRLHVVRPPIDPRFCSGPAGPKRGNLVVSVGRWQDPAKDAGLLRRTLRRPMNCEVIVVGPEGERIFGDLSGSMRYLGGIAPAELRQIYQEANVCLITSRWEGSHNAGHEALATGCTVVGPSIPAVQSMVLGGEFGIVASERRPAALAAAITDELSGWMAGRRDAETIAAYWRSLVTPEAVATRILSLAGRVEPEGGV